MCNRYGLHSPLGTLQNEFTFVTQPGLILLPRWNVAPSQPVLVVRREEDHREGSLVRWGLDGSWDGGPGLVMNARVETAQTKPFFRDAMLHRRCVVPADGFFEWREEGRIRQPWWITFDGGPVLFAGIVQPARRDVPEACAILTTDANDTVRPIHDRMPLVVPRDAIDTWLDTTIAPGEALAALPPIDARHTHARRVSTQVNAVRNEGPTMLDPPAQGSLF